MKKPTIGIIAIAKENHYKVEIEEMLEFYKVWTAKDTSIDTQFSDGVVFLETDVVTTAKRMESNGCDLIVFIIGTWIFSSVVISAVNDLHMPFVLYGLSDQVANGNLGASLQIRYVLQEMDKQFLYMCGPVRDEENIAVLRKYLRAAWVKSTMRNKKIATIGGKCMMMYQTQVNEYSWKKTLGIDFPQYDSLQIFKEMEKIDDNEAHAVEQAFLKRVDAVRWEVGNDKIAEDAIFTQAKMYLAFKRMQKLYDIDVFANKCMPEMSSIAYGYGCAACLATCMLNEDNIMTACEADVPAGISMYILNLLTGQKVFFADIARMHKEENSVTFFNCGTAPISMADKTQGIELLPIPGNISDEAVPREYFCNKMRGAAVKFELESGKRVTVLRLGGNDETLRMHVANAMTIPRSVTKEEVLGQRWPGFGLKFEDNCVNFFQNTLGHHYSLVFGDWSEELGYLAKVLGIQFVYNK